MPKRLFVLRMREQEQIIRDLFRIISRLSVMTSYTRDDVIGWIDFTPEVDWCLTLLFDGWKREAPSARTLSSNPTKPRTEVPEAGSVGAERPGCLPSILKKKQRVTSSNSECDIRKQVDISISISSDEGGWCPNPLTQKEEREHLKMDWKVGSSY